MKHFSTLLLLLLVNSEVRYFPSILFGHILVGSGAARYETSFFVRASKNTRLNLSLFTDRGQPMRASFADEGGESAATGTNFEAFVLADRPLYITLGLVQNEAKDDVAVKTGWATFQSAERIDVMAVVRTLTPDGKVVTRHILASQEPPRGE